MTRSGMHLKSEPGHLLAETYSSENLKQSCRKLAHPSLRDTESQLLMHYVTPGHKRTTHACELFHFSIADTLALFKRNER